MAHPAIDNSLKYFIVAALRRWWGWTDCKNERR
jgi:hypothetical protein